ncbi:MAG TPA: redoxin domain-containing protein [Planctomycetota bacterium]|nr:redoxin domain-containing protein [Planctomycetota bacterium]
MVHPTIRRNTFVTRVLPFLLLAGGTSVFSGEETSTPAKDSAVAPARPPELEAAIEFQRAGKWDEAITRLEELRKKKLAAEVHATALVELGESYFAKGKSAFEGELEGVDPDPLFKKAIGVFEEAVKLHGKIEDPVAYGAYMIGSSNLMLGDMKAAADAYQKTYFDYQKTKWGRKALVRLGISLGAQGETEKAIQIFNAYLRFHPDEADAEGEKVRDYLSQLNLVGRSAPGLHADGWMNGTIESLEDLRGDVVVVVFFATWCNICSRHMPQLKRQILKWQEKGVAFVGVANPDDPKSTQPIETYVRSKEIPFLDLAFDRRERSWKTYGVTALPSVVVIDRKGTIRWRGHMTFLGNTLLEKLTKE